MRKAKSSHFRYGILYSRSRTHRCLGHQTPSFPTTFVLQLGFWAEHSINLFYGYRVSYPQLCSLHQSISSPTTWFHAVSLGSSSCLSAASMPWWKKAARVGGQDDPLSSSTAASPTPRKIFPSGIKLLFCPESSVVECVIRTSLVHRQTSS